jgi:hypothetical protein
MDQNHKSSSFELLSRVPLHHPISETYEFSAPTNIPKQTQDLWGLGIKKEKTRPMGWVEWVPQKAGNYNNPTALTPPGFTQTSVE